VYRYTYSIISRTQQHARHSLTTCHGFADHDLYSDDESQSTGHVLSLDSGKKLETHGAVGLRPEHIIRLAQELHIESSPDDPHVGHIQRIYSPEQNPKPLKVMWGTEKLTSEEVLAHTGTETATAPSTIGENMDMDSEETPKNKGDVSGGPADKATAWRTQDSGFFKKEVVEDKISLEELMNMPTPPLAFPPRPFSPLSTRATAQNNHEHLSAQSERAHQHTHSTSPQHVPPTTQALETHGRGNHSEGHAAPQQDAPHMLAAHMPAAATSMNGKSNRDPSLANESYTSGGESAAYPHPLRLNSEQPHSSARVEQASASATGPEVQATPAPPDFTSQAYTGAKSPPAMDAAIHGQSAQSAETPGHTAFFEGNDGKTPAHPSTSLGWSSVAETSPIPTIDEAHKSAASMTKALPERNGGEPLHSNKHNNSQFLDTPSLIEDNSLSDGRDENTVRTYLYTCNVHVRARLCVCVCVRLFFFVI
jgi:hypothetical protein